VLPPDDSNDFTHRGCFAVGFGRTISNPAMSNTLQWLQMTAITNVECRNRFVGIQYADVLDTHICVMSQPPQDGICNGDAGGPVFCHASESDTSTEYLAGIVSWFATVQNNCNLQYPQASSRISKYLDWIRINSM